MLILSLDTTSPDGSVALYRGGEALGEVRAEVKSNYSVALFEMTDEVLGGTGLKLAEVDLFAAATGPGSFTGIRVGLAATQGWAKVFGRPVSGVSVLEAMVEAAHPRGNVAVPLLDARRSEFYLGIFRRQAARDTEAEPEGSFLLSGEGMALDAAGISALVDELKRSGETEIEFIGRDNDLAAGELSRRLPSPLKWTTVSGYHAGAIARIAARAATHGRLQQPEDLDAYYIRRSDAELNWRG